MSNAKHPLLLAIAVAHGVLALGHTVGFPENLKDGNQTVLLTNGTEQRP